MRGEETIYPVACPRGSLCPPLVAGFSNALALPIKSLLSKGVLCFYLYTIFFPGGFLP